MTTSETWFDGIARVGAGIEGIHRVFAGGKGASGEPKVVPMSRELITAPTLIQGYGGAEVTPGSWETLEHTLDCAIWIPVDSETLGSGYSLAIRFIDGVMAAYPVRGRAYNLHPDLQSALVTGFDQIEGRTWGDPQARRDYVVLPYTIQAVVRRAAVYAAA